MPIPIPIGKSYTAEVDGTIWKCVACAHCQTLFAYKMQRSASGEGLSLLFLNNQGAEEQAVETARENLIQQLETDFDALPCPQCGNYQEFMFQRIRWQRWLAAIALGLWLLVLAVPLLPIGYVLSIHSSYNYNPTVPQAMRSCFGLAALMAGSGIVWLIFHAVRCCRYDPNNPAEYDQRIHEAQSRTVSGEMLRELVAKADNSKTAST